MGAIQDAGRYSAIPMARAPHKALRVAGVCVARSKERGLASGRHAGSDPRPGDRHLPLSRARLSHAPSRSLDRLKGKVGEARSRTRGGGSAREVRSVRAVRPQAFHGGPAAQSLPVQPDATGAHARPGGVAAHACALPNDRRRASHPAVATPVDQVSAGRSQVANEPRSSAAARGVWRSARTRGAGQSCADLRIRAIGVIRKMRSWSGQTS